MMVWNKNASFFLSFITGSLFHDNVLYVIEGEYCKIYLKGIYSSTITMRRICVGGGSSEWLSLFIYFLWLATCLILTPSKTASTSSSSPNLFPVYRSYWTNPPLVSFPLLWQQAIFILLFSHSYFTYGCIPCHLHYIYNLFFSVQGAKKSQ